MDLVVVQSHETNRVAVLKGANDGHSSASANLIVMEQQPLESFECARAQRLRDRLSLRIGPPQPAEVEQGRAAHDALELRRVQLVDYWLVLGFIGQRTEREFSGEALGAERRDAVEGRGAECDHLCERESWRAQRAAAVRA
jgi:hypothetical protein